MNWIKFSTFGFNTIHITLKLVTVFKNCHNNKKKLFDYISDNFEKYSRNDGEATVGWQG